MRLAVLLPVALLVAALVAACTPAERATPDPTPPAPNPTGEALAAPDPCLEPVSGDHPISRLPGADATVLAACAARDLPAERAGGTVVVSGDGAASSDPALAALLAARHDLALVLTGADALSPPAAAELARRRPDDVVIVGGDATVGASVVAELGGLLPDAAIERIAGDDAVGTAAAVAARLDTDPAAPVLLAAADEPGDTLLAAGAAARSGAELLLTHADRVPAVTAGRLDEADVVVLVGDGDAIPYGIERALDRELDDTTVRRVSGGDASETAASVARAFPGDGPIIAVHAGDPGAAVVAAWVAGQHDGVVVPVDGDEPGRAADRYLRLDGLSPDREVRLIGGDDRLATPLVEALEERFVEAAQGGPPSQMRGVWIHLFDDTLKTRRGIDEALDDAAAANLNTVIVEVVRRHDAYHRSEVLPRTPDPALEDGLDVLARTIEGAHDRGLEVHAWVPLMPTYHRVYEELDLPADHVWVRHGPDSDEPWVTFDVDGEPYRDYLDPGVPAVTDHVVAVASEIAERYPVDAIHVDYLRYEGQRSGYNPTALSRFHEETGRSDRPAPDDAQWSAWRRAQTDALAARLAAEVRHADPDVAVTHAVTTMGASPDRSGGFHGTRPWRDVFQDWPSWLRDGHVDAVFPMHYFRDTDPDQRAWFRGWIAFDEQLAEECRDAGRGTCTIAPGIGAWLNAPSHSLAQLEEAVTRTDGAVVYSYQQNAADEPHDELLRRVVADPFGRPAPAPALTR